MARRTGEKYGAIIEAAVQIIAEHGYHRAQMSRIAEAAGVASGTIYLYFDSKQDLLLSMFQEKLGRIVESGRQRLDQCPDPRAKLRLLIDHHFRSLAGDPQLAMVTQVELRQPDLVIRQEISKVMTAYFGVIDDIVAVGQQQGIFKANLNPKLVRNLIYGTIDQQVTAWVMAGMKFNLVDLVDATYELFMDGIEAEWAAGAVGAGAAALDRPAGD